ncbi:MAG: aspartate aminotransferase family protein [Crocinitomicaceae bacterium]|nr:aspartate aminotransferase family protein [Crocinitomicaceae bacterium]
MLTEQLLNDGLAQTTLHPLNIRVKSASGSIILLDDGREVIDFVSGIGVSSFGHSHPEIIQALKNQIDQHLHVMVYGEMRQESQDLAAASLCSILPSSMDAVYFVNSGAEAIDGALKLSRNCTKRTRIMAVEGGYHGNTFGALSVSSNEARKAPFAPMVPDVDFMEWNDHGALQTIDESFAAVIVETVQGDAGIRIPSVKWMHALRNRCTEKGVLLILDEIQCGMGRTGKPFAFEHFSIEPDVLCLGKALGGGLPMGAFVSSKARMRQLATSPELGHITTFGGHPLPCASSAAALSLLKKIDFPAMEERAGNFQSRMMAHELVQDVRRIGAYIAVELKDAASVAFCVDHALKNGLLIYFFLSTPNAFRVAPPLTMDSDTWLKATELMCQTLDACALIEST